MTSDEYRRVGELYHAAMGLAPEARVDFLAGACGDDDHLRRNVESLLQAHEQADSYFAAPALEVAAELLAQQEIPSLAGGRLGHYQMQSLIGAGGMGQVYLADDTRLGRKVALKVLPAAFSADQDRIRRFEQEAKAASSLNQPNILTIYEIGEIDNCHFIVSEYVEGEMLRQLMKNGAMTYPTILDVGIQVASALSAAHSAGIIHRDIKPENVMVRPDGLVKVLDFGLAKLTESPESLNVENAPPTDVRTEAGRVMGTPSYMSPEQARGLKVDARSDLFSLGVVLYEMIAGRAPFAGPTPTDVIISIVHHEAAPLTEAPREYEQIVAKALGKDRDERYQTATELLTDLKRLRQRLELEAVSEGVRNAATPDTRSKGRLVARRTWLWALAAGLIVLVTALSLSRRTPEIAVQPKTPLIAVLPFKNSSGERESDYFADGLTDEVIRNLSIIEGLAVRSRTSSFAFKDKPHNLREVAEKLNVNYVLDGSVLRSGGNLRVTAQFTRVDDDKPLWTGKFDHEPKDIFKIQDEISLGIVNELRVNLGRGRRRYETSVEAYDLYLRAGSESNLPDRTGARLAQQVRLYEEVIAKDPSFAPAHARLALIYAEQSVQFPLDDPNDAAQKLRVAAQRAIRLDPLLEEAHIALGRMHARDGRWEQAESSFREAIRLNPNRSDTYIQYADWLLEPVGRTAEAVDQIQIAERVDPLSARVKEDLATKLISVGRLDEAAAHLEQDDQNGHVASTIRLARLRLGQGRIAEALQLLEKHPDRPGNPLLRGWLGNVYARSGRREEAEKIAAISQFPNEKALIYAGLDEKDRTLEALEMMGSRGPQRVGRFLTYPEFDFLRGDPRLAALRKKVGLPK